MSVVSPDVDLVAPAYRWVPGHCSPTPAAEAAELAESAGLHLDPEQLVMLEAFLAAPDQGKPVFETAVICSRQQGKTWALMAAVLYDLFIAGDRLVVWTAHEFPTARESFNDFLGLIESCSWLSAEVKRVDRTRGEEGFQLKNGAQLRFRARTKAGGRGIAGDKVILDEAFALQDTHMGALIPIMTTRPYGQVRYASSAGLLHSAVLRGLRDRGRPGGDPSLAYAEWAAAEKCSDEACDHDRGRPGCVCDDPEFWRQANPGIARRRSDWADYIANERRALPVGEFTRERMGWWQDPVAGAADMDMAAWLGRADAKAAPVDPVRVAVDCAPAGTSAAIVVCGADARDVSDPAAVLEVVRHERRNRWVVSTLVSMREELGEFSPILDPAGSAGALIPDLEAAGFELDLLSGRESAQACAAFTTGVTEGRLWHRDEQALNAAVAGVRLRPVGDAFKFSRRDSTVDICTAVAAAGAFFRWLGETDTDYDIESSIF